MNRINILFALILMGSPNLHAENADGGSAASNRLSARQAELESKYLALFNTYDPTYLADDNICKTFRETELQAVRKKRIEALTKKIEMEDRILNLCKRTAWDRFSDNVGHFVDAGKNSILLDDFTGVAHRATHWALSKDTYDILTYERLDKVLSEQCFPGKPRLNTYFKRALVRDDINPALYGTTGGLIAGWYVLKGAGKIIFAPAKSILVARGATPASFSKIKTAGYWLATPLVGLSLFYTVKEKKDQQDGAQIEEHDGQFSSSIGLEATFPEPEVDLAAQECLGAAQNIKDAPTEDLRNYWKGSAKTKCEHFMSRAEYALNSLTTDDYNRCHPGNRGAADRITKQMSEISLLTF